VKSVLITGAGGFCARHLAERLAGEGDFHIAGLDLHAQAPDGVPLDDYLPVDLGEASQVAAAVGRVRPEMVFHLAGLVKGHPSDLYRVNLLGSIHLFESLRDAAPQARVLAVGSAAEYGRVDEADMPITEEHVCRSFGAYGLSKYGLTLAAKDYAHSHGMKVTVVRPFNIVGAGIPPSLVVGAVLQRAKEALAAEAEPVVDIGNLDTQRDFIAVEDAVDAYVRLIQGEHWGEVFNICLGRPRSILSVVELLLSFSARPVHLRVDPALVRPSDVQTVYGSREKAERAFGFRPTTSLEDSLHAAWEAAMGSQR